MVPDYFLSTLQQSYRPYPMSLISEIPKKTSNEQIDISKYIQLIRRVLTRLRIIQYSMKRKTNSSKTSVPQLRGLIVRSTSFNPRHKVEDPDEPHCLAVAQSLEEMRDRVDERISFQQALQQNINILIQDMKEVYDNFLHNNDAQEATQEYITCEEEPQSVRNVFQVKKMSQSIKTTLNLNVLRSSVRKTTKKLVKPNINRSNSKKELSPLQSKIRSSISESKLKMLLPLLQLSRHSEDNSLEIQELLRRKKDLEVGPKTERFNCQTSRKVMGLLTWKDKQKGLFYQNDDGEAMRINSSRKVKDRNKLETTEVKYIPGSTLYQNIRKKPITELVTKKKNKRKNYQVIGSSTRAAIDQFSQKNEKSHFNLNFNLKLNQGVTLALQDEPDSHSYLRLPTVI